MAVHLTPIFALFLYHPMIQVRTCICTFTFVYRIRPSQLSCLGSLVGKSVAWKADGCGFESHLTQPIFLLKMTFLSELCCCCLASLEVIVHVHLTQSCTNCNCSSHQGLTLYILNTYTCIDIQHLTTRPVHCALFPLYVYTLHVHVH